jgi:alpha-L-fucosidase
MGKQHAIKAFTYLPRHDKLPEGLVDSYIYAISNDGKNWQQVAEGEFANIRSNPVEQIITLDHTYNARYFKFTAKRVISGNGVAVAELGVLVK